MAALSLLLAIVGCSSNNGVAAFVAPRPTTKTTTTSSPLPARAAATSDSDPGRRRRRRDVVAGRWESSDDYRDDRRDDVVPFGGVELGRRGALGRFLAASAAIVVGGLPAGAEPPTLLAASEFSESPTSEASIARMRYDGREDLPPPPPPPPPPPRSPRRERAAGRRRRTSTATRPGRSVPPTRGPNPPSRARSWPNRRSRPTSLPPRSNPR